VPNAAVLFVVDLAATRAFYERAVGYRVVEDVAGDHCVLASTAGSLTLVQVPAEVARDIALTDPPVRREETPIKLIFDVASIERLRAAMPGAVDPADTEWEYGGFRHCDGVDPEGNVLQLRERVAP
jgi:catechol 2,3-dioxygenase-like lactoylglutathione lyase family enzyme